LVSALAAIIRRDLADPWTQTAALSSSARTAPALLESLVRDPGFIVKPGPAHHALLTKLAALVAARSDDADLNRALHLLAEARDAGAAWPAAVLEGLGQGLRNRQQSLNRLLDAPPARFKEVVQLARPFFHESAVAALDTKRPLDERLTAVRLLAWGPF